MEEQNEILLYSEDEVDSGIVATTETDRKRTNSRRSNGAGSRETTPDLREQINKRDQVDEYRSPPKKNKSSEPQQRPGEKYKNPTFDKNRLETHKDHRNQNWNNWTKKPNRPSQRQRARNQFGNDFNDRPNTFVETRDPNENHNKNSGTDQRELIDSLRKINSLNEENKTISRKYERISFELNELRKSNNQTLRTNEELTKQSRMDTETIQTLEKKSITRTITDIPTTNRNQMVDTESVKRERHIKVLKDQVRRAKEEADQDQIRFHKLKSEKNKIEETLDKILVECSCRKDETQPL